LSPWPGIIEVIGRTGLFDYIEYSGDYSPFNLEQLDNFGRTIELFPKMSLAIKVEEPSKDFIAQRAIDSGFQSVFFTDCRTAKEVAECIRIVKPETPEDMGIHGACIRRSVGFVGDSAEDWIKAMRDVVIGFVIEKKEAIENLEEILSLKGVDMVVLGPLDYSISIGKPGQTRSPEVQKAHQYMIETALKKGVIPKVGVPTFEAAKPFWDMGVRHFSVGWDTLTLYNWYQQQGKEMREFMSR
jgi:2-keto-3-deoxy-L-rhamnonate aldolase RhmA